MNKDNKKIKVDNTDISFSELKNYCKYLIDEYEKIKSGDGGRIMTNLIQFYEEGIFSCGLRITKL